MRGLEFWKHVSIGRYVESDSPVHRLAPATKYLWLAVVVIAASASRSAIVVGASFAAPLAFARLARVRASFLLRGFTPVLPFLTIAAAFQVLFSWPGDASRVLVSLGPVSLSSREAVAVALMALRFAAIMTAIGLFTSVTSEGDTARGVEDFFKPLERIGFPARAFALTIAVAFRFIPIVAGEFESVVKAQAARGADFGSGTRNPLRKAKAYLPLVVPVTVRALERAEALAEAMEARCYGVGEATRYAETAGGAADVFAKVSALAFAAGAIAAGAMASGAMAAGAASIR
ncbi:MAG: energy-coupling factor transporter transmembrane protein EcfT [Spirochaetes bacterium]|nr:energy-coupling factor transporter transmembrane protein EcfT [Spirochaetota bacterium]MBU1079545.1 energy-coupling factor transporter transmembrane protein EcfT [Spirochaetota bacterium]